MSGYLQRLVSSAMKPSVGVHPVIPPLFSMQPGAGNEDLAEPAASGIAPRMSMAFETDREPPSVYPNVDAIPPNPSPVVTPAMRSPAEDSSSLYTGQAPGEQWHASTSGERPAFSAEPASTRPIYSPLLPERVSTLPLPTVDSHPAFPLTATSRAGRDAADQIRSSRTNRREPDEIQITIGRIEVTAVPEAPARPAAKAGRKQTSLDEYLRRADGRGR
jgi:hypothetical protein